MPLKVKRIFEKEYGKKKGDRIFYALQNKNNKAFLKPILKSTPIKFKAKNKKSKQINLFKNWKEGYYYEI